MLAFKEMSESFEEYLNSYSYPATPKGLYDPVRYIMSSGGKRIRPILVLAAYNLYREDIEKAFPAAHALEIFHNFSLVHDDLMDNADIRRGKPSVHKQYDDDTAILSGDVMLILSYQQFEEYSSLGGRLLKLFNQTAMEVCEGQRMDMEFEQMSRPGIDEYIEMIRLKTSVLIACALKMGAMIGGAGEADARHLYEFGQNMGIAFQIQDDLLDSFGDSEMTGKKQGGDILQGKKTYLFLKALELLSNDEARELMDIYDNRMALEDEQRIARVLELFRISHVEVHAQELKLVYQQLALSHLEALDISASRKNVLSQFAADLLDRSN